MAGAAARRRERSAAPRVSRDAVRPQGGRCFRPAATGVGAQAGGGAMTFDAVVNGVGARLLSERNFDLILAPALADYQIERCQRAPDWASRVAVLAALSG